MESLEIARAEFWEAMDGLKKVHTQEALDAQKLKIDVAREQLLEVDPEFRAMIAERKRLAKVNADRMKAEHKARMTEFDAQASVARAKSDLLCRGSKGGDIDNWVQQKKFKVLSYDEEKKQSEEELWCPICREKDTSNNIMNGVPTCFDPSHRPHRLVLRSELKNYNRAYRKKLLIRRKK